MKQEGFTLLELLISLAVLSIGILGIMNLMISTVASVGDTKNRVVAANLAQEGTEIALNVRNTNWIAGSSYDTGLAVGTWCADAADQSLSACGSYTINWDGSFYTHDPGDDTGFARRIVIAAGNDGANAFIRVQSIVEWDDQSVTAETHLYDWR